MKRVSKKEMDDLQAMINSMSRPKDSNTAAEDEANSFASDAFSMADDLAKRNKKIRKGITGR